MYDRPQSKTQQAYKLGRNLDRFEGYGEEEYSYDAEVIEPKRYGRSINQYFWQPEPIAEFDHIEMEGTLSFLEGIDYLHTEPSLPIMLRRMLYVLNSVREFPHQVIPVSIEDDVASSVYNPYQRSGKVNTTDYVAVQILEDADVFDYEKSVYKPSRYPNSRRVNRVKKMVLKEPESGFPPLFRIPEKPLELYVLPQAKFLLEEAGITGVRFIDIAWD